MTLSSIFEQVAGKPVEDRTYNIGEISQKTGLMKTANGWVKPKSGKQPGAKKEEGNSITGANGNLSERAKFAYESNAKKLSTEGLESVIRNKDKVFAKHNDEIAEIYKKELAKRNAGKVESKPTEKAPKTVQEVIKAKNDRIAELSKAHPNEWAMKGHNTDFDRIVENDPVMKKLDSIDFESESKPFTIQGKDADHTALRDSAPRVLTGDCKVRIRK